MARLEFAVVVTVIGVIITLALSRLAELQALGLDAQRQTMAAQQQSASALAQARCPDGAASAVSLSAPVALCP